jgi:hypothetical protein
VPRMVDDLADFFGGGLELGRVVGGAICGCVFWLGGSRAKAVHWVSCVGVCWFIGAGVGEGIGVIWAGGVAGGGGVGFGRG